MIDNLTTWCDDLRRLVDFVENHGELTSGYIPHFTLNLFANDADDMAKRARVLGTSSKHESGGYYSLDRSFGEHNISLNIIRDKVCERVQVDVKTVLVPDPDAPLVEVIEKVYEWKCPDSVLAGSLASDLSGDEPG